MKFIRASMHDNDNVLFIVDYQFYAGQEEIIDEWCWQAFDYHPRQGMVMTFKSLQDLQYFLLKWS